MHLMKNKKPWANLTLADRLLVARACGLGYVCMIGLLIIQKVTIQFSLIGNDESFTTGTI